MNLYNFHEESEKLHRFDDRETIPRIFWNKYEHILSPKTWKEMLIRKEKYLAKDPEYAFKYSRYLKKPWKPGEAAIASDAKFAVRYAVLVLNKPFPEAEPVIAKSKEVDYYLGQFPERKEAIEKLK